MDFFTQYLQPALNFIGIALAVILVFNLIIIVHELGHFLAAKWRGMTPDRFQIWFGKPIWKKTINGVQYGLGWIPAGGFVSLPQMVDMQRIEGTVVGGEDKPPLPPAKPWDKIIVAFAGPLFSFGLAVVLSVLVWLIGYPERPHTPAVVGWAMPGGPADKAGLKPGDKIEEIDGVKILNFDGAFNSVRERLAFSKGEKISLLVDRNGEKIPLTSDYIAEKGTWLKRSGLRQIKIAPQEPLIVGEFLKNSPAQNAGMKEGDEVIRINGQPVLSFLAVQHFANQSPEQPLEVTVKRGAEEKVLKIKPFKPVQGHEEMLKNYSLGAVFYQKELRDKRINRHPTPSEQIYMGATAISRTFKGVYHGSVKVDNMSGFVKIISVYSNLFTIENGWKLVLWFSVILNINLAFMNLLPLPILDGGHIVMALVEWVRRKPANPRVLEALQGAFFFLIIGFMLYVNWFDTLDEVNDRKPPDVVYPEPALQNQPVN